MKYLRVVIDETLRLYPPVPWDPKFAVHDDVLPSGCKVPAGALVSWSAYAMGRLERYWEEPEKFDPTRFLSASEKRHPFLFIPFQAGPRICLGQQMAYLEVSVVLCTLLRKFRFHLVPNQDITYVPNITWLAKNGIKMVVESRSKHMNMY